MRVLVILALVACSREPVDTPAVTTPPPPPPPPPAQLTRVTIKAIGMYCEESCPLKVRTALANNPDVYELGFDVSHESIFVSYDATLGPAKQVTKPMLVAIKQAGFDPWLAKEEWPPDARVQVLRSTSSNHRGPAEDDAPRHEHH